MNQTESKAGNTRECEERLSVLLGTAKAILKELGEPRLLATQIPRLRTRLTDAIAIAEGRQP